MNCNCNNINNTDGSGLTAYISHVYGNVLRLAIPLTLRTVTMENGEMVATDTDFIPSSDYPVTVVFSKGGVKISLEATMQNGNIAYIEDLGTIPVGKYDIAVLCKDDNGNPYRFKQVTALHIVDATADANIPSDIEYEVTTWYLDAAIFLALKGEDGVGIDDIITESSGEIGGMNTVTIVLTNGETRTFTVMNGSGQVDSDFNINSPHPLSNSTITAKINAIDSSIDGLFGGADYDSQSKTIRFYNKDRSRVLATLDARPFIKDGMVKSVYISNNTLVITFNTDAGREAIGVSLSSIFNPNNYYTKTQVNNLLGNYYNKDVIDNLVRNNASLLDDGRLGNLQSSPIVLDGMYWDNDEWPDVVAGDYYKVYHTVSRDKHEIVLYKWINDGTVVRQVRVYRDVDPTAIYYDKDTETFYRYDTAEDDFIEIETGSGSGGYEPPVGGIPKSDLASDVQTSLGKADTALQSQEQADWNESDSSDPAYIKNKPTIPDVSGFATLSDVADAVADLVDSAPETLDTLNELAAALGDDPNFATTITTALAGKVDKETGKSLMTDAERTKLQGIAAGAEVNVQPNWKQTNTSADDYIKNKPTLATVATSGSYNDLADKPTIPAAVTVDSTITQNGTNPVQGSAIYSALDNKANINGSARELFNASTLQVCSNDEGVLMNAVYSDDEMLLRFIGSADGGSLYYTFDGSGSAKTIATTADIASCVPTSRKINNKPLSTDITLTASDVGALPSSTSIPTKTSDLTNDSGFVTETALAQDLDRKQDTLTFDNAPTANSNNPVKSGGIKQAIDDKLSNVTVNAIPAGSVAVIDGYYSDSATDVLSAGKGKDLNDRLTEVCGGIAYEDVETVVEHTEDVTMTTGKYIPANQGVGQVCPMTTTNTTISDCAIVNLQAGQKLEIKGVGGKASRLWAILDKDTHVIQSVADANTDDSGLGIPIITKTIIAETDCIVVVNVYNANGTPPYGNNSNTPYSVKLTTYTTEMVPVGTPIDGILGGMQESIEDNTERIAVLESATDGALTGDKALEMTTTMPSTAAAFHALWDKFVTDGWAARTTIASPNSKPVYLYHIDPYNKIVKNPNNTAAFTVADNDYFQKKKILITSGIHGDEKQTPLWLYEFFNRILYNDEFAAMRSAFDFYVVPLVNPTGYDANTRNNYNNVNINRDFKRQTQVETQAVCGLIDDGNFDMYLDSHQLSGGSGKSNISPAVCAALICSSTATEDTLRNLCTMFSRGGARADIALNAHFNKTVAQSCFAWPPITVTGDDMQSHEYCAWKGIADSFAFEFTQYAYQFSGSDVIYNNGSMVYGNTVFHYLMMEFLN